MAVVMGTGRIPTSTSNDHFFCFEKNKNVKGAVPSALLIIFWKLGLDKNAARVKRFEFWTNLSLSIWLFDLNVPPPLGRKKYVDAVVLFVLVIIFWTLGLGKNAAWVKRFEIRTNLSVLQVLIYLVIRFKCATPCGSEKKREMGCACSDQTLKF